MEGDTAERPELEQARVSLRSRLAHSLAGIIADSDKGVSVGILGGAGSGRSALISSICESLTHDDPDSWVIVPFDVSTQLSASVGGSHHNKSVALVSRTYFHSLIRCSKPESFLKHPASFLGCLFRELEVLIHFGLCVRYRTGLALLLAIMLFVTLFSLSSREMIGEISMRPVWLMEVGGSLVLIGLVAILMQALYRLLKWSPEALTFSELDALFRFRSKSLLEGRKRIVVVATGFHVCTLEELPSLLENVHVLLSSNQATLICELDPCVTLASFAAQYQALGRYQQNVPAQHLARERLSRLVDLPVNLDLLLGEYLRTLPLYSEGPAGKLNQRQFDLLNKWCAYFGCHNPRRQNRLHCSYRLLLQLYGEEMSISGGDGGTLDDLTADISCPLLITLCALEYVNGFANQHKRDKLLVWLARLGQRGFAEETETTLAEIDADRKLSDEVVAIVHRHRALVQPFLLPALERFEPAFAANQG